MAIVRPQPAKRLELALLALLNWRAFQEVLRVTALATGGVRSRKQCCAQDSGEMQPGTVYFLCVRASNFKPMRLIRSVFEQVYLHIYWENLYGAEAIA